MGLRGGVDAFKDLFEEIATEAGPHHPFARYGGKQDVEALSDILFFASQDEFPGGIVEGRGKAPACA